MNSKVILVGVVSAICAVYPILVSSHGILLDPPGRSSLWRYPEFEQYEVPHNYEDNQLFCGGVVIQHSFNGGKCGECGDPYNQTKPRDNENGGYYGRGIIARNYTKGQIIDAYVELTAVHLGHFEFRLCPLRSPDQIELEGCFLQNLLQFEDGSYTYPITDMEEMHYHMKLRLPEDLSCERCVIQWHYLTGNSWGVCPNGTETIGCGPQETFRGCSDVRIV